MTCLAKHTEYQSSDPDVICPSCGLGNENIEGMYMLDDDEAADDDCHLLHSDSMWECYSCGFKCSGHVLGVLSGEDE